MIQDMEGHSKPRPRLQHWPLTRIQRQWDRSRAIEQVSRASGHSNRSVGPQLPRLVVNSLWPPI